MVLQPGEGDRLKARRILRFVNHGEVRQLLISA
jgi:hypothetical protein